MTTTCELQINFSVKFSLHQISRSWLSDIPRLFERNWLWGLLAVDALIVVLHIYLGATEPRIPPIFNLAMDRSIGEYLGYAELGLGSILLLAVFAKTREPLMLSFAILLAVMMLDDSAGLHEIGGGYFVVSMGLTDGSVFDAKDKGEMIVWLIYAAILLPVMLVGLARTPLDRWFRAIGLALLTAVLTGFAVVLDGIHEGVCSINGGFPYCFQLLDLVEDGGEKITQSLILAHVIYLSRNTAAPALFNFSQQLLPSRLSLHLR